MWFYWCLKYSSTTNANYRYKLSIKIAESNQLPAITVLEAA